MVSSIYHPHIHYLVQELAYSQFYSKSYWEVCDSGPVSGTWGGMNATVLPKMGTKVQISQPHSSKMKMLKWIDLHTHYRTFMTFNAHSKLQTLWEVWFHSALEQWNHEGRAGILTLPLWLNSINHALQLCQLIPHQRWHSPTWWKHTKR